MSVDIQNRRFGRLAAAIVAAVGLLALTVPLNTAKAQVYFGFGPGGFDIGFGPPPAYYYPPYYAPYYAPYYPPYYYRW